MHAPQRMQRSISCMSPPTRLVRPASTSMKTMCSGPSRSSAPRGPVKIPLPELLRSLREKQVDRGLRPARERLAFRVWSWVAQHPRLYALATAAAVRLLRLLGGTSGLIGRLPFGSEWTRGRFFPAPRSWRTFRALYAAGPRRLQSRRGAATTATASPPGGSAGKGEY